MLKEYHSPQMKKVIISKEKELKENLKRCKFYAQIENQGFFRGCCSENLDKYKNKLIQARIECKKHRDKYFCD